MKRGDRFTPIGRRRDTTLGSVPIRHIFWNRFALLCTEPEQEERRSEDG